MNAVGWLLMAIGGFGVVLPLLLGIIPVLVCCLILSAASGGRKDRGPRK